MYPDMVKYFADRGYEPFRYDYLMQRPPQAAASQPVTQQWVDRVSNYLRSKGVPGLERGGNAHRMASALAHHVAAHYNENGPRA